MIDDFKKYTKHAAVNRLRNLLRSEPIKNVVSEAKQCDISKGGFDVAAAPYTEIKNASAEAKSGTTRPSAPIFITGRFRSGSSLFWNLFRAIDGFTAYYEPFNERKWFDKSMRGHNVDPTHVGIGNYWDEYNDVPELADFYNEDWIRYRLYMGEDSFDYAMYKYIGLLIEHAPARPVLQFNRVDFRLPWLRKNFPDTKVLHIYRHPRDQWCSVLRNVEKFPCDAGGDFPDFFYQKDWLSDLSSVFPFLKKEYLMHPYQGFYLLWRLSFMFGERYSDFSCSLEGLCEEPENHMRKICEVVSADVPWNDSLEALVGSCNSGKWMAYAKDEWFHSHEIYCEELLQRFFL